MIRIFFCITFVVLFLILMIPVGFVFFIMGKFNPHAKDMASMVLIKYAFKILLFLAGTRLTVIGEDRIPKDEPVLYVGNHRSYFDIVATGSRSFRPTGYIAKKELRKVPLLSWWMVNIRCEFLDRKDIRQGLQVIMDCIKKVKEEKISYFIFPEGTRNDGEEGSLLPFHEGSLKIAEKSGCPIVPVAISNTHEIMEAHFPRIRAVPAVIEYCDPIYVKDLSKEEKKGLTGRIENIITEKLKEHNVS
ncbi:MAG: 1-acyl-sn-glycerol-3-phosphate acyltransferase [Lachnospiraceae bacterium]|nr:1-acyl-sn-glycerol-3-phosphate acyltransferase [Lachnospiraceae bacterium]